MQKVTIIQNTLVDDVEITSNEDGENWYQDNISPTNRVKTKHAFNNNIDKIKRMERITLEINKAMYVLMLINSNKLIFLCDILNLIKFSDISFTDLKNEQNVCFIIEK